MSKKRRKKRTGQRDFRKNYYQSQRERRLASYKRKYRPYSEYRPPHTDYRRIQDGRRFSPIGADIQRTIYGTPAEYKASTAGRPTPFRYEKMAFRDSRRIVTCKRRKARRETLFKTKKIGSGRSTKKFRNRKMNENSEVRC